MYQFVKPKESVELIVSTKRVIMMESLSFGIIIFISIQKTKSIVLALLAILKLAIRVPRDTEAETITKQYFTAPLICGKWLLWTKIRAKLGFLPLSTSVIAMHNGTS